MLDSRKELIDQVVGADWTWYERGCRRVDSAPQSDADGSPDDFPLEINVRVTSRPAMDGEEPEITIRERSVTVYKWLESSYDVSVTFTMRVGFPTDDANVLRRFVEMVGFEYVLGLIRAAFIDGARVMGLEPPIFPAVQFTGSQAADAKAFTPRQSKRSGDRSKRRLKASGPPWKAESIGSGKFRFTNVSGGKLGMIVLTPVDLTEVRVEDGVRDDPHVVPKPIDAGESFVAVVRGKGVRVTATAVPSMTNVYWDLSVS